MLDTASTTTDCIHRDAFIGLFDEDSERSLAPRSPRSVSLGLLSPSALSPSDSDAASHSLSYQERNCFRDAHLNTTHNEGLMTSASSLVTSSSTSSECYAAQEESRVLLEHCRSRASSLAQIGVEEGPAFLPLPPKALDSHHGAIDDSCVGRYDSARCFGSSDALLVQYRCLDLVSFEKKHGLTTAAPDDPEAVEPFYVTAFAGCSQAVAVGYSNGLCRVLAHQGVPLCTWEDHQNEVLALSFNNEGTYIASCGVDAQIYVYNLEQSETKALRLRGKTFHFTCPSPMTCLEIYPKFSSLHSTRMIVCGTGCGDLLLYSKDGFYTSTSSLHSGEGAITAVSWNPMMPVVAWSNSIGVKILDVISKEKISFVPYDQKELRLLEHYASSGVSPSLVWIDSRRIVLGCGVTVKIGELKRYEQLPSRLASTTSEFYLELTYGFSLPYVSYSVALVPDDFGWPFPTEVTTDAPPILGIVTSTEGPANEPFQGSELALKDAPAPSPSSKPLEALTRASQWPEGTAPRDIHTIVHHLVRLDGTVLASDCLPLAGWAPTLSASRKKMLRVVACTLPSLNYIVGPTSLLQVSRVSSEDRAAWYLGNEQYEAAVRVAHTAKDVQLIHGIADLCLRTLLDSKEVDRALSLVSSIRLQDVEKSRRFWKRCVALFDEFHCLHRLLPCLPMLPLSPSSLVYPVVEDAFCRLAATQPLFLRSALQQWFRPLLQCTGLRERLIDQLRRCIVTKERPTGKRNGNTSLLRSGVAQQTVRKECLALLLDVNEQIAEAFELFLQTHATDLLLELVESRAVSHGSLVRELVLQHLPELCLLDLRRVMTLLAEGSGGEQNAKTLLFPVTLVTQRLKAYRYYLFCYLRACFTRNPVVVKAFHAQYISVLAEFAPQSLLHCLQQLHQSHMLTNPGYALSVCRRRQKELECSAAEAGSADKVHSPLRPPRRRYPSGRVRSSSCDPTEVADREALSDTGASDLSSTAAAVKQSSSERTAIMITDLLTSEVFLLFIMERLKEALHVLLYQLKDVVAALDLVTATRDPELWDVLVEAIQENPEALELIFGHLDETQLVESASVMMLRSSRTSAGTAGSPGFFPFAPVHMLRRLPASAFERIPMIARKLGTLFRQLSEQEVVHHLCYESTLEDYDEVGADYVVRLQRGVPVQWHSAGSAAATPSFASSTKFSSSRSPGAWLGFFASVAKDIPLQHPVGASVDEQRQDTIAFRGPEVGARGLYEERSRPPLSLLTTSLSADDPPDASVGCRNDQGPEGSKSAVYSDTVYSANLTSRGVVQLREMMVTAGRSLVNKAGGSMMTSFSSTDAAQTSSPSLLALPMRASVSLPSVCSVCWNGVVRESSSKSIDGSLSIVSPAQNSSAILVFHCGHVAHTSCYKTVQGRHSEPSTLGVESSCVTSQKGCFLCAKTPLYHLRLALHR